MRVLIVDDEPVARRGLRRQLEALPGIACVGECTGRDDAVTAIVTHQPDVVLLDVQLGRATAFEVIEAIGVEAMPLVIFVTAYHRHALKAFDVHALDYVLKPVDPERLRDALERAGTQLALRREASLADRLEGLLATGVATPGERAPPPPATRFVVRDGGRLTLLETEQIDWFESAGNYVKVHTGGRTHLMRTTMERIAQRVAEGRQYVRVRRSALINFRAIASLERYGQGTYVVHLRDGTQVISSRYYQSGLRQLLR